MQGKPHGHGTRRTGRQNVDTHSFYIGSWVRGARHGYGVMEEAGEKYLGMWEEDVRQGPGCVVNIDGVYYQGKFLNNKLSGNGLMIFDDGAKYEGEFSGFGKFSGKGVLYSGGRIYVGTFSGNYQDKMKFQGEITKLPDSVPDNDMKEIISPDDKWTEIFNNWNKCVGTDPTKLWMNIAYAFGSQADGNAQNLKDCLQVIPTAGQEEPLTVADLRVIETYIHEAVANKMHPFSTLVTQLIEAFKASYGGIHQTNSDSTLIKLARKVCVYYYFIQHIQLHDCIQELFLMITCMSAVVRVMFPALQEDTSSSLVPFFLYLDRSRENVKNVMLSP